VSAPAQAPPAREGPAPAFAAVRVRLGLVVLLFALAAVGWWWTVREMQAMDDGPWTGLGTLGWFLGVWVVMMAAMMFPSVNALAGDVLAWDRAGRWVAGATLVVAAVYELTPLKDVCLGKCRSPLGQLLGSWRDGPAGALRMGAKNGAWCVGCCWALMASLFALGVMSIVWMAVVAGIIAVEKTLPWRRVATYGTTVLLLALGVLLFVAPTAIPGLTVPATASMTEMAP
jgi:predicted metal-binding membrane protein